MTKLGRILGAFIKQKFRSEISETSRAQWNGTFRLHRPDSNHGVCKTRTLYLRMADADGKMRIEKCGWEKMLIVRGKNEKCGWCGETSFKRKFISLSTMLCTCIWNLKTMPVNKWVRSLVNAKSKGKMVIFEALFKSLLCFQCSSNLQGVFIDNWSRDCEVYKKHYRAVFLINAKFVGMEQITCKNYNKSSWMQVYKIILTRARPEQSFSFLYAVFNGIKPLWDEASFPKLIIILKY